MYLDFDLLLERSGQEYKTRVINSPAGQATGAFHLPFSDAESNGILSRLGESRREARHLVSPQAAGGIDLPKLELAKAFGGRLYEAVFTAKLHACFRGSLDEANRSGSGLRLRLRLAEVPELATLPWEYLYHADLNRFLCLSNQTPIVRYLDLPERIQPLAVQPPLKILVMISSPQDQPPLEVENEWEKLRGALAEPQRRNLVALEKMENATLPALQKKLRQVDFNIFHFIGHGDFDPQKQDGVLIFENDAEQSHQVSSQYLGALLHDHKPLRLVVLNACEGGRSSRHDPFSGTAQSLVQQGIPAVIAMQFPVTDIAAITFAQNFYSALADGYPADAALSEARKAIFSQGNEVEWGTPVLYMRAPDGQIFDMASVVGTESDDLKTKDVNRKTKNVSSKMESEKPSESPTTVQQSVTDAGGQVIQAGRDVVITQPQSGADEKKDFGKRLALWLGIVATAITIITSIIKFVPDVLAPKSTRFFGEVRYANKPEGVVGALVEVRSQIDGPIIGSGKTGSNGVFNFSVKERNEETVYVTVALGDSVGFEDYLPLAGSPSIPFKPFKRKA